MKKTIILAMGILMTITAYSQSAVQTWTEDFDSTVSFNAIPVGSWIADPVHYLPGSSASKPQSYWAVVPNTHGSSVILQTPMYDFSNMSYITLQFSQICKVSPRDTVLIQYQESGSSTWVNLPAYSYRGSATNYATSGFNAASYSEWQANDSTLIPDQTWWKDELFDLGEDLQFGYFTFRFVIKRGQTPGTQQSYGWLLENIKIVAATYQLYSPTVEFISPYIRDTVYGTGPWEINAKVKTNTKAPIEIPSLIYTATYNNVSVSNTLVMTNVRGDSLWKTTIPQYQAGTIVNYSITAKDTLGNQKTQTSKYEVVIGEENTVIVGTGTTNDVWVPIARTGTYNWGWSRYLYYASELETTTKGGMITRFAFQTTSTPPNISIPAQTCYFSLTDDAALVAGYMDPSNPAYGLTQVWTGTLNMSPDWCEIILDQPFYLPAGKNLMVHWFFMHGTTLAGLGIDFYHQATAQNRTCDASETNPASVGSRGGTPSLKVANARFVFAGSSGDNSVSLHSINMSDTIAVAPGVQVYIPVTVKNKGRLNLTSATIYYSVNGGAAQQYNWTGNLPWDYDSNNTIGYYIPKVNGRDTLRVWISRPNGVYDNTTYDDTLTKIIYGSSDIIMEFLNPPADTVNNTGPFAINARIYSLSGTNIGTVSLNVDTSSVGIPTSFTLPMTSDAVSGIYRTTIPHTLFGSDVSYSITIQDILGNVVTIAEHFYIKRPTGGDTNSVALVSINTPQEGGVTIGTSIPVEVTIRNKGMDNLTSCIIEWTLNGSLQSSYNYTGNLPEDFTQTITIDNYYPLTLGQRDTIVVKVSMPNSIIDPKQNDDSLRILTIGCDGSLYGTKTIDATTGDFTSIANALTAIRECYLTGDLTLLLKGSYTENVTISDFTPYLRGYRLTITSADNHADSAIIQPASGVGITLRNTKNITIKAITVNTTTGTSGIQFTAACSNIVIRDCKILANPTATSTSVTAAPIYKASGTGTVDSIFIINNILNGSHAGLFFYGGTGTGEYGTNVIFDSNTLTNNYLYGMRVYYTDFLHISHNKIRSRDSLSAQRWDGLSLQYVNGDIIANQIIQRNPAIPMDGFNLGYYNHYLTNKRALIANNELIYQVSNIRGTGIYFNWVNADFVHNSFYMSSTGELNALYLEAVTNNRLTLKNNNIVVNSATAGDLFKYTGTTAMNQYDIDYNNFYTTRAYIGTFSTTQITSVAQLLQYFPTALHMTSIAPSYVDISVNTELTVNNTGYYCPALSNVRQDIEGKVRPTGQATMGAYQISPYTRDLAINQILSWNTEVIEHQTVSVNIEVQNSGTGDIQSAVFGWSLNGQKQASIPWSSATPVPFLGKQNIYMGSFTVDATKSYNVTVWIESVDNTTDMYHRNDTFRAVATNMPLVEWVEPFVDDTICFLTFDVNARVRTATGAPVSSPRLTLITIIDDKYTLNDTLSMRLRNGIWQVSIPEQYYGSKVIYSLTVADTMNVVTTITDSVYIQFEGFGIIDPALKIGTGTSTVTTNPYYIGYEYSHTRNYYMAYEIDPQKRGGYIRSIAFYNTTATASNCDNISFYLKAVSDSLTTAIYIDPVTDGATLVWGSATVTTVQGWNVFVLHAPFYLPPGKNLLVYCNNRDASTGNNGSYPYWQYTATTSGRSCYSYGNGTFPPTYTYLTTSRPNIQLDIYGSSPYSKNNLALMNILNPVNNPNNLCTPDYSPVEVILTNMGNNDHNFTQDIVSISMEIIDPLATKYATSLILNTGTLESRTSDTLNLMSALPIMYSGSYKIKIWIDNPIANISYDDTLYYEYISGRIGLPVDVDFSAPVLPTQLVPTIIVGSKPWEPYTPDINDPVQPNPDNGTGILRFDGTVGSSALLSTRQLDLFGSDEPQLEFWYYHDTALPFTDASYLDVNAIVGGVSNNLAHLLVRSDSIHGWKHYAIPLVLFTGTSQCLLIQFEAMNKSNINQYIDRIRITAKQDMAITGIVTDYSACDLQNKEWKVILTNLTDPVLDYSNTPTGIMLEIAGISQTFSKTLDIGFLSGTLSDTVSLSPMFDFAKGTYQVKAYLTTPLDGNPVNDTLITSIVINSDLEVSTEKLSGNNTNCMGAEGYAYQIVSIYNSGNIDLSDIVVVLQIDTGGISPYTVIRDTITGTITPSSTVVHEFVQPYKVPWNNDYQVRVTAYLLCDSIIANHTMAIQECVDMEDLYIIDITEPSGEKDTIGSAINLTARIYNRSDIKDFTNTRITVLVKNSQGVQTASATETINTIRALNTRSYTFGVPYIVPNDSVYYLTVFIDSYEGYAFNDTSRITRYTIDSTTNIGIGLIKETNAFTLSQNIPNPANNSTRIDYSIPEAGKIIFHVHSITGQLLYSKTIETKRGANSIELNTTTFAAGVYFYSMEYKGQRLVRQLIIK